MEEEAAYVTVLETLKNSKGILPGKININCIILLLSLI